MQLKNPDLLRHQCLINGQWLSATEGGVIEVTNPANGELVGVVPKMGKAETAVAIEGANVAFQAWREYTAKERGTLLRKWFDLIMANQADLALIMTIEQGKPLAESMGEIAFAAAYVDWFAEEGKRVYGDLIPATQRNRQLVVMKEPVGVCAAVTPWNFPAAMITRKAAPALAAGCTIVIKPASQTPFSALALCYLAEQAGIPAGVINVVTGDSGAIGTELSTNPTVRKLSFTGSTSVGIKLMEQSASTVKKVTMELGGNAPFIVFNDADLDAAVEGAIVSKFRNSGQTCVCANRILVQEGVYEEFIKRFTIAVNALKLGNGMEPGVTSGPVIDAKAVKFMTALVDDAKAKGGKIVAGGKVGDLPGTFFEPTLVAYASEDMRVAKEEIFGPIAPVFAFKDEADAIRLANDTEYGLACYLYTNDNKRIWKMSSKLEYGMVGINVSLVATEVAPFGGMKASGVGREGSKYGIDDYLEIKYLCIET
ncbi:NAD-dependent succinate-semialdehyde dehydrogenase [Leeia sp. TBRC 13508]|uniref:NAD-dependent succinate-semialdehyde dehydrogenase n=1 Tax=Leeia speluncae TaxID=2884804 RepID=A0ABS8D8U6_9NEIS|nr:NAD-dependent succinate-semialdehyde dehydrogenase [Leeia speluncae]MCB6184649.1 NAD-dependent succinate-semialdehyde dehydrogenase [Leeia speluncae]